MKKPNFMFIKRVLLVSMVMAASTVVGVNAQATEVVVNGGFETGVLGPWVVSGPPTTAGCDGPNWEVYAGSPSPSGACNLTDPPVSGTFAAYTGFDGFGPLEYVLEQSISLPGSISSATLSWLNDYEIDIFDGVAPRTFSIDLFDTVGGSTLLTNLFTLNFPVGTITDSGGWVANSLDVTTALSALAGNNVSLRFTAIVPEEFTGPAGFSIDNISLDATIPLPATVWLFGSGLLGLVGMARRKKT